MEEVLQELQQLLEEISNEKLIGDTANRYVIRNTINVNLDLSERVAKQNEDCRCRMGKKKFGC